MQSSALSGASKPAPITAPIGALDNLSFSAEELAVIDARAGDGAMNRWKKISPDLPL